MIVFELEELSDSSYLPSSVCDITNVEGAPYSSMVESLWYTIRFGLTVEVEEDLTS